jgi:hypothetical protein
MRKIKAVVFYQKIYKGQVQWHMSIIPANQEARGWEDGRLRSARAKSTRSYLKNNQSKKGWGCSSSGRVAANLKALSIAEREKRERERERGGEREREKVCHRGQKGEKDERQ